MVPEEDEMKPTRVWCVVTGEGRPLVNTVAETEQEAWLKYSPNPEFRRLDTVAFRLRCVRCTLTVEE